MPALAWITVILLCLIGAFCIVYSCFTAKERGPILSNTYLFFSEQERKNIKKEEEYKTVTVVFRLLGIICLILASEIITKCSYLLIPAAILILALIVYAIHDGYKTWKKF